MDGWRKRKMFGRNKGNVQDDEAWSGKMYKRGKEGGVRNEEYSLDVMKGKKTDRKE